MTRCPTPTRALRDSRGIALVEFAIGLPVFLAAIMGGLELANFCLMQQRVTQIASALAMTAARGSEQIDEADIHQLMTGVELSAGGTSIMANGRVILSSVRLNAAANGQWIEWQRCDGSRTTASAYGVQGKGKSDATLQTVGGSPGIKAPAGVDIMVAEASYAYQPIIGGLFTSFTTGKTLKAVAAHVVRDRTTFGIKNDGALSGTALNPC